MRTRHVLAGTLLTAVLGLASVTAMGGLPAGAGKKEGAAVAAEPAPQALCPVSGKPIDKTVSTSYGGQKVYFCCPKCVESFKQDPEAQMMKLAQADVIAESVQALCPVSGEPITKKVHVDHEGRRVYFCCADCVATFKADPAKYLPLVGRQTVAEGEEHSAEQEGHHHEAQHKHEHQGD